MFLDIWAPSSGCGFSATGILKNIAVSRHAANFLAAATINLNMPPGSGGDSPMKGSGGAAMRVHSKRISKTTAILGALCVAAAALWSSVSKAETQVYLLRGWFGVFSTGLDTLADDLRSKGVKAETVGHLAWKSTVANIIKHRAAGKSGALVLIGHSQGANNVIEMARTLEKEGIAVDLLVTLAPLLQDPIPGNVARAINYYNSPGWGAPVKAVVGYRGNLSNVNLGGDLGIAHIAMDKSPNIQAEIERAILSVRQTR
jgi:hypothetical protein